MISAKIILIIIKTYIYLIFIMYNGQNINNSIFMRTLNETKRNEK